MAQAADRIRCDRCTGHYVVDAASDGSPRVRCNKCGHVREAAEPAPASIPGKWTVIGPDGKAMSFDTWEELTESRRPQAIAANARAMEEANSALKDLKPAAEKKSASALLDIGPGPKLALADMDSAIDLGEPMQRKSRPGATTMASGSGTGKLEPLLVRSFSQPPATQNTPKVEWAPKVDKSSLPPRVDDNTLRVEIAPSQIAASKPSESTPAAPATTRVMDGDRPTAPKGGVAAAADSIDELDSDSLLEDLSENEDDEAPLSLRDAIPDEEELGDDDLEEPDPHEKLSLKDLVVYPPAKTSHAPGPKTSQAPPPKSSQAPPPKSSQAPPPKTSQTPPPPRASQVPPRPKSLSRPDVRADEPQLSRPPPTIVVEEDKAAEKTGASKRRVAAAAQLAKEAEKPNRTWMWAALGAVLLIGVGWRVSQSPDQTTQPQPKPQPTIAPPTPVVTPATAATNDTPPAPTTSATDSVDLPPTTPSATPTVATNNNTPPANPNPNPTPVANPNPNPTPAPVTEPKPATSVEKKPTVAVTDAPGSMSELLDKAGAAKRKGDLATARDLYTRVIAMSPNNVEANGGLGDVAKAQGDLNAAKTSYERALAASPTYSPALLGLADVEWDQGNQASAKKRYAQIVDRMGDRAPARAKERSQ